MLPTTAFNYTDHDQATEALADILQDLQDHAAERREWKALNFHTGALDHKMATLTRQASALREYIVTNWPPMIPPADASWIY